MTGAVYDQKTPERLAQRNGYRDRDWGTRAGNRRTADPEAGQGQLLPGFAEPRRMAEKALTAVIQEAYVHGVSNPLGRRSGQGDRDERHLQEPGQPAMRGDPR